MSHPRGGVAPASVPPDTSPPDTSAPGQPDADSVRELRRIRALLVLIATIGVVIALYFAREVMLPILLGIMLALTLSPLIRTASRAGLPPPIASALLILSLALVIGFGGYAASGPISDWIKDAPALGQKVQRKLEGLMSSVEQVKEASDQVEEITSQGEDGSVQQVSLEQPGILNSAAGYAASFATTVSCALFLALFILASGDMFYAKIVASYPRLSEKKRALTIVHGVERAISRYLLTITLINAGLGIVIFLAMWAVGLPSAFVWGLIAFGFNFLPFIGAIAGILLVGLYAIITIEPLTSALLAPLLYFAATALEGQIITPTILGRRLKLNTVSVFVTVVFWGWLWGIPGALMAVPFLVIVKVICDNVDSLRTLGSFLGSADTIVAEKRAAETA